MKITDYGKWSQLNIITSGISLRSPQYHYLKGYINHTIAENYTCTYYSHLLHGKSVANYVKTTQHGWLLEPL